MSAYEINKLFRDMSLDDGLKGRYEADCTAVMNEYGLNSEEQRLINENNFAGLEQYGVNALILMRVKDMNHVSMPDMLKNLRGLNTI